MKSKNKFKKTIFFLLLFLSFDFFLTKYFFKKTIYWSEINNNYFPKSAWRIKSDIYHHDIAKNVNTNEKWGSLKYKLITNSLGFIDLNQNNVKLKNDQKKRIYVVGDSFIEGVGYDYEYTAIGMATKNLSDKYEILNSSVTSYSPSIYYRKTKHYIDKGIQFDYCLIFLDISDIPDENFIDEDSSGNIFDIREKKKETSFKGNVYKVSRFYRDNFSSGMIIAVIRELVGDYKSDVKKKILASKKFNKSFFKLDENDFNLYKSTHIDRSMWTFNAKYSERWKEKGLKKSDYYLTKLVNMLNKNNIKSYLIIYPNPAQILYNNENINENYWINWSKKNNIKLINLYKYFFTGDKTQVIKKYFISGDVHWNKTGHLFVYEALNKELFNSF